MGRFEITGRNGATAEIAADEFRIEGGWVVFHDPTGEIDRVREEVVTRVRRL